MIEWQDPQKDETDISKRKLWQSNCGSYKIVYSSPKYGKALLPDVYYAIFVDQKQENRAEIIISKHRKHDTAAMACEKHLRVMKKKPVEEPKKTKRRR